jgi:hypothetical protein
MPITQYGVYLSKLFGCMTWQHVTECHWFTKFVDEDLCGLFVDCESIDAESCVDCISGKIYEHEYETCA